MAKSLWASTQQDMSVRYFHVHIALNVVFLPPRTKSDHAR